MKVRITSVEYDTDGNDINLPNEFTFDIPKSISNDDVEVDEFICNKISDETGYCIISYVQETL